MYCQRNKYKNEEYYKLKKAASFAVENNLECHAGHGINYETVSKISKIYDISELNIGHFIIGESIFFGLKDSIIKMKKKINNSRKNIILEESA